MTLASIKTKLSKLLVAATQTNLGRTITHALVAFVTALLPQLAFTSVADLRATLIAAFPAAAVVVFRSLFPNVPIGDLVAKLVPAKLVPGVAPVPSAPPTSLSPEVAQVVYPGTAPSLTPVISLPAAPTVAVDPQAVAPEEEEALTTPTPEFTPPATPEPPLAAAPSA